MTTRQITVSMFIFTLIIGLAFLAMLVKVNYSLEQSNRAVENLQNQIDDLRAQDHLATEQIIKFSHDHDQMANDIDVTQELQRKQAQAILDLKKGKKK